jgi:hypothetical protein
MTLLAAIRSARARRAERRLEEELMAEARIELDRARAALDRASDLVLAAVDGGDLEQAQAGQKLLWATMHLQDRTAVAGEWGVL